MTLSVLLNRDPCFHFILMSGDTLITLLNNEPSDPKYSTPGSVYINIHTIFT